MSFWAGNVGTETSGSILSPSNQNMLVGIKPTVGRVSRYGVIPITADQDTPGPMTRTVTDAAIMLGAMEGARPTRTIRRRRSVRRRRAATIRDSSTRRDCRARASASRARSSTIGRRPASTTPRGGLNDAQRKIMDEAIAVLKQQGATIVDPGRHPERRRHESPKQFPQLESVQWARQREGPRRGLLDRVQVRHEARLQHLAPIARRRRRR